MTMTTAASKPKQPQHRFEPGALIASRYRIISRLGKGGMGEVFRADDILLGQPVALKFLPESARGNLNLLTRFYDEVRIARQITHPNVCRVYDIGEVEGQPYLSMEYIDGEDLASLLRRIGRLPADKATEFARKMCVGLAAAHSQGVLHRDLKPGNIMIDGRGELRIADFGLAAVSSQLDEAEVRHGTPAYMAPEQLEGREVSVQSDLYALGLVFYEMFTGKPAHRGDTAADILKLRKESTLSEPSSLVSDLDPSVERAIKQCLDPDPRKRPASALALAASLPGGDPLAAALAAGEVPSPELVAASGSTEAVPRKYTIPALAGVVVGLAIITFGLSRLQGVNFMPLDNPPEVLTSRARDILRDLGFERDADSALGFRQSGQNARYKQRKIRDLAGWTEEYRNPPWPLEFWYRESPRPMFSTTDDAVSLTNPPQNVPGMKSIVVDLRGKLLKLVAIPPGRGKGGIEPTADWNALFRSAGLGLSEFEEVPPQWTVAAQSDVRKAWTGPYDGAKNVDVRVEAAAFEGKPVYFEVLWPWQVQEATGNQSSLFNRVFTISFSVLLVIILIASILFARYNWKAGRGDRKGALRAGASLAVLYLAGWTLGAHHNFSDVDGEMAFIGRAIANALFTMAFFWTLYLALEPWVRRYWPQSLVTWSRILQGKWRDPLVGRDLLYGSFASVIYLGAICLFIFANIRQGAGLDDDFGVANLMGFNWVLGRLLGGARLSITGAVQFFLVLFLLRAILRRQWLAGLIFVALWTGVGTRNGVNNGLVWYYPALLFGAIYSTLLVVLTRYGFFAVAVTIFAIDTGITLVFTTNFSAWYGLSSWMMLSVIAGLALFGFKLSLGGRPLLATPATERTAPLR
jgi:serine/threonine-protein kinase